MQSLPNINLDPLNIYHFDENSADLCERLKAKDKNAFKQLYNQYSAALFGNIYRMVKNKDKANHILERTFALAWASIGSYDSHKFKIFTWLNQKALKLAKNS